MIQGTRQSLVNGGWRGSHPGVPPTTRPFSIPMECPSRWWGGASSRHSAETPSVALVPSPFDLAPSRKRQISFIEFESLGFLLEFLRRSLRNTRPKTLRPILRLQIFAFDPQNMDRFSPDDLHSIDTSWRLAPSPTIRRGRSQLFHPHILPLRRPQLSVRVHALVLALARLALWRAPDSRVYGDVALQAKRTAPDTLLAIPRPKDLVRKVWAPNLTLVIAAAAARPYLS